MSAKKTILDLKFELNQSKNRLELSLIGASMSESSGGKRKFLDIIIKPRGAGRGGDGPKKNHVTVSPGIFIKTLFDGIKPKGAGKGGDGKKNGVTLAPISFMKAFGDGIKPKGAGKGGDGPKRKPRPKRKPGQKSNHK